MEWKLRSPWLVQSVLTCFALRLKGRTVAKVTVEGPLLSMLKANITSLEWCLGALDVQRLACPGSTAASQHKEIGSIRKSTTMEELHFVQAPPPQVAAAAHPCPSPPPRIQVAANVE